MTSEQILSAAETALRAGRGEEALQACAQLSAQGQSSPRLDIIHGSSLFALSRLAEAEAVLANGARRWPGEPALHEALANIRWMRGDGESFARDFEAAVACAPDALPLRLRCANLLCKADLRDRAEPLLRDGLTRAPNDPSILLALGALLDEVNRTKEGVLLLERSAALAPNSDSVRSNLALALLRLRRTDEALRIITTARAATPLDGAWIAYETMALRQLNNPRYHDLCDYDLMVRAYDLPAPAGFDDVAAFNAALAQSLAPLHVMDAHPLGQSLRGGSQTNRSLLSCDDPVIRAYLAALDEPIRAYTGLMTNRDHPWSGRKTGAHKLAGCWSARLKPGGYHVNHIHPAGWISSAYYVALPDVVTRGDTQEGWIKFGEPRWPTPACTIEKVIQPKVGRLVLFPSYMWHGTIPFSSGERLTTPFDVVPA